MKKIIFLSTILEFRRKWPSPLLLKMELGPPNTEDTQEI